jgi:hypothetical protein
MLVRNCGADEDVRAWTKILRLRNSSLAFAHTAIIAAFQWSYTLRLLCFE